MTALTFVPPAYPTPKVHITVGPVVAGLNLPKSMKNANYNQIAHQALCSNGSGEGSDAISALENLMDFFQNPAHWKQAFTVIDPVDESGFDLSEWVAAAAHWYHAGEVVIERIDGLVIVRAPGYQAD